MKQKFYNFMRGRYGVDRLNQWILGCALIMILLSYFTTSIFLIIGYILWFISLYRMFSKQINKRYNENMIFNQKMRGYDRYKTLIKRKLSDKENAYFLCPTCKQTVRVPKGRGKITITCPKCRSQFNKRS